MHPFYGMMCGIPQGSTLEPLLFNIFMSYLILATLMLTTINWQSEACYMIFMLYLPKLNQKKITVLITREVLTHLKTLWVVHTSMSHYGNPISLFFFFFSFKQTELIGDLETKKVKTYGDLSIGELGFLFNCPT